MRKIRWSVIVLLVAILVIAMVGCNGIEIPSDAKITVTFETNGGTTIKPIVVTADTEFKMPKDPKKEGYTFAGWYLDAEFSQKLDKSYYNAHKGETPPEIPESITIYAKWFEGTHEHTVEVVDSQVETCTEDGFTLSVCSDPECNYIKVRTTEKLGHDLVTQEAQEPTCTEVGWDEYGACSRCDYTTRVEIEALGHDIKSTTLTEADCTNTGSRKDTCSRCDYSQTATTPALGHTASDWITDTAASCEEEGTKHKECTVCHTTLGTAKIPQLEHIKSDWITTKEPTCTQKGTKIKECTICHFECEMTYIDVIGHNYVNGVCSECGATTVTNGLTYSYNTDTQSYTITDYTGSATEVVIPSTYNDGVNGSHPVTSIGSSAFYGCKGLTSVIIGSGVTSIGLHAFFECENLTSVHITDLSAWCEIDFDFWSSNPLQYAHNLYLNGILITDLVIPNDVNKIGANAFSGATGLTSVTIPDSVTNIGSRSFDSCYRITSVIIPESVTNIGDWAFYNCSGLTSVIIPESVTSIGANAFSRATGLTSITVEEGNTKYHSSGNCLIETESKTLIAGCNTSVIPNDGSVTGIVSYAFYGCKGLTSVIIPDGVTSIEAYTFSDCTGLTRVIIPDGVTSIGNDAFYRCTSLTSVTIPASVTSIGNCAFLECYRLIEVYNKSNLTITAGSYDNGYVAYYAKNVYTDTKGQSKLLTDENGYVIYTDGKDKLLIGYVGTATALTLPEEITEINQGIFYGNANITSIDIPEGVTSIGDSAFNGCTGITTVNWNAVNCASQGMSIFDGCSKLATVNIGDKVATIPENLFAVCTGITSITMPDSVENIGYGAFEGCTGLTSVTISDSVTSIGDNAFSGCSSVTSITYEGTMAQWNAISKDSDWNRASAIKTIVCTDGTITLS